jgi:hypothetical protein
MIFAQFWCLDGKFGVVRVSSASVGQGAMIVRWKLLRLMVTFYVGG